MESLLALAFLLDAQLVCAKVYVNHLNALFEEKPDDNFLLDLQWCTYDTSKTIQLIFTNSRINIIDYSIFGKFLMERLGEVYRQYENLEDFSSKVISIWGKLPEEILQIEPFWSMSYAGEPLTWGGTEQTREIFEKMFNHYRAEEEG